MFRVVPALFLGLLLSAPVLAQQATDPARHVAELKTQLAPGKQIFIARQMALTPAEEAGFWPLYDEHQKELSDLVRRRRANSAAYAKAAVAGNIGEDFAEDLAEEALRIEQDEAKLNERTYSRMSRSVSPEKALRYLQLEKQIDTLLRYELAASVSL